MKHNLKRKYHMTLGLLLFSFSLFVLATSAYFTKLYMDQFQGTMGFVDVELEAYFVDDLGEKVPAIEVEIAPGVSKPGVYYINIVSNSGDYYFEDFRLYVKVLSNVDTYFRIKIYEQLTLIYTNFEGVITELSILSEEYMPFNYMTSSWYDNRNLDNYLYYTERVKRVDIDVPLEIGLIESYFQNQSFSNYAPGYSLEIAFSVEAVQADSGPVQVWGLTTPPWGGVW